MRKKVNSDRFFVMKGIYDILHNHYCCNADNIIEYLDTKSINKLKDILCQLLDDNDTDEMGINNAVKDFIIWEDEHITKIELLENMLDYSNYNITEIVQFLNTLTIDERDYYCNYCLIDDIRDEFERWRLQNELSQNN